jgi:uncharacterized protein (DUF488 family)
MTIFTVGHSTHSTDELLGLLAAHGVRRLVDVRRYPASRRHPHLARAPLSAALTAAGIEYVWAEALGGRRSRVKGSPHVGWREPGFAGYADYMDTPEFAAAAHELVRLAERVPTAIMCAEALPERCHRRLIADWLVSHHLRVEHIVGPKRLRRHVLTPFARIKGGRIVYDGGTQGSLKLER